MAAVSGERGFNIGWALGISVAAHVVLLVLASFVTLVAAVVAVPDEPDEIRINFQLPAVSDVRGPQIPAGSPLEPLPRSAPVAAPRPGTAQRVAPEEPAPEVFAETEEPPPLPVAEERSSDASRPNALERDSQTEGAAIADASGTVAPPLAGESGTDGQRRGSMSRAVRDYGRALGEFARQRESRGLAESAGAQHVITPDFSQIPSSGFGVGNLVFESRDFDWSDYGRQIYMAIWRAWHERLWLTTDEFERWAHENATWWLDHQTQVRFVIHASGEVTGIAQESGSGCFPLDQSAIDALAEVVLPPLPAGFPRESEVVHARFLAVGEIRGMRPVLGRLKRMGIF